MRTGSTEPWATHRGVHENQNIRDIRYKHKYIVVLQRVGRSRISVLHPRRSATSAAVRDAGRNIDAAGRNGPTRNSGLRCCGAVTVVSVGLAACCVPFKVRLNR